MQAVHNHSIIVASVPSPTGRKQAVVYLLVLAFIGDEIALDEAICQ